VKLGYFGFFFVLFFFFHFRPVWILGMCWERKGIWDALMSITGKHVYPLVVFGCSMVLSDFESLFEKCWSLFCVTRNLFAMK
jgi:hypothetical protein